VWIGGGYGSTGVTITDAGVISADGTTTLEGTVSIGGGFGGTGVTITDAGVLSVDGTSTLAGSVSIGGGTAINSAGWQEFGGGYQGSRASGAHFPGLTITNTESSARTTMCLWMELQL